MKKNFRKFLLIIAFLTSVNFYSQAITNEERVEIAKKIEIDIEKYVEKHIKNIEINAIEIQELKNHMLDEKISIENLEKAIYQYKVTKLKELYFEKNTEKLNYFLPIKNKGIDQVTCINGGFENINSIASDYGFGTRNGNINGCNTVAAVPNVVTLPVNDFNSNTTIIDRNSPNFVQFDPTLNSAVYGNIQVPTISPNGGNTCVKLNSTQVWPHDDVSSLTKNISISSTDNFIDYEFSLILFNPSHNPQWQNPTFRIELIVNGNVVNTKCYDVNRRNCLYNLTPSGGIVYYTGWRCDRIDVTNYRGSNVTLRYTVTGCAQTGHWGTVYIDNVCGYSCPAPASGSLQINPLGNCDAINNGVYQVCGTFTPPANGSLSNLNLSYSLNGGGFINSGLTPIITGNNYCFNLPASVFGANPNGNTYQFQVTANFIDSCPIGNFPLQNSTFASVTFQNCCQPTLNIGNIVAIAPYRQERSNWIRQNGFIIQNGNVVYHAGNFIELNPGFETRRNVRYSAYISPCTGNYVYKANDNVDNDDEELYALDEKDFEEEVQLINKISLIPNPSNGNLTISFEGNQIEEIKIHSLDGRIVYFDKGIKGSSVNLDVFSFKNGIYTVSIQTVDGVIITEKLIKN